jgi:hypothetical protein
LTRRRVQCRRGGKDTSRMMDIVFVGITLLFFALSWGFVKLCERL